MLTGWVISIICVSALIECQKPPPLPTRYPTIQECDAALIAFVVEWKPIKGRYTINCVRD